MDSAAPPYLQDITKPHTLHHTETNDHSKPAVEGATLHTWDKEGLMHSIEQGVPLKHVHTDDRSQPHIDPNAHVQTNQHKELLTEVRAAAQHKALVRELSAVSAAAGGGEGVIGQLHHVDAADKGAPAIDPSTRLQTWDKPAFLQEVAADHHLHHVPPQQIHDASAPVIDAHAHIGQNPAKDLLRQISAGEVPELKHVTLPPQ